MTLQLMMMHHHTKFGHKMFSDTENIGQTNLHWHFKPFEPFCDLDPEHRDQSVSKDTSVYDDIPSNSVWMQKRSAVQKIQYKQSHFDSTSPHCDLDLEQSNTFFSKDTPVHDDILSNLVGCKTDHRSEDTVETVIFWFYKPSLWPWPWSSHTTLSAWHSSSWWCITTPSLVTKSSVVQRTLAGQTFIDILNLCCNGCFEHANQVFSQELVS